MSETSRVCVCGSVAGSCGRCDKHGRDLHGYPCPGCQREWREANPEKAAEIDRLVNSTLGKRPRRGGDQ